MKAITAAIILTVCSLNVFAVSFNCNKASTFVEVAICQDSTLGQLDDYLSENYQGMLESDLGTTVQSLKKEQRQWLSKRNKCTNKQCIEKLYRSRINETCDYAVVTGMHPVCTYLD
jgi:uncharacterized protein